MTRYDGASFLTFDTSDGLTANTVLDLSEDARGRLVVATQGGGLCLLEGQRFLPVRAGSGLVSDDVQRVTRDRDGTLWVATEKGITHLAATPVHYGTEHGLPSSNVLLARRDARGRLWAGTSGGLALLREGLFVPIAAETLGGTVVRTILDWGEDLLVGGDAGLFVYRDGRLRPFPAELPPGAGRAVYDAAFDRGGALWLATMNGALRWDGRLLEHYGPRQGLAGTGVHRLFVDREGDVWFGTESGASKLGPGAFIAYTGADGLSHPFVRALGEDDAGRVWVGTRAGVSLFDGRGFMTIRDGLPSERIYAFASLGGGRMLVGTREGLALWDGRRIARVWRAADGLPSAYVTSLFRARDGRVFVGTSAGLAIWDEGRLTTVDGVLKDTYVMTLHDDPRGWIWAGLRTGGIAITDGATTHRLPLDAGLSGETVWSIDRDTRGAMWIGTNGFGLFRVEGESVTRFTTRQGLVNDFVWQVLADDEGTVWCYTNRGLDRTDGRTFTHFGTGDGLVDLEGSAGAALRQTSGDLWFGSGSGLSRFVPSRLVKNTVPPVVVFDTVTSAAGRVVPGARLPHDTRRLVFRFAALSFRVESGVRFRHRLLPAEKTWSEPGTDRRLEFARIAPGHYVLEVQASNENDVPSAAPARFAFTILPPWWGTTWFRAAAALGLVLLFGLAATWRTRRLEADRERLARLVGERTAELSEKNRELKRMATVDVLTSVHNRRHFMDELETELKRTSRVEGGGTVALLLLDLDHFKEVNDTHGHSVGDQALAAVAERIRSVVRTTDLVARYGGEEFAVLLPVTGCEGALVIARKIHAAVAAEPFHAGERTVRLTVSIGVAHLAPLTEWDETLSRRLIDRADAALYRAKENGRDRVELAA